MNKDSEYLALLKEAKSENTSGDRLQELAVLNGDLAQIVASNISTHPELLAELAKHESKAVRKAVVSNSNTPTKTLLELCEQFPQEFLDNPILELHVRLALVRNPNTPAKALKKLANDSDDLVLEYILENPQCTLEIKEIIFKNFAESEIPSFSRFALFLSDYAESSVLAENNNSISWLERYAIACNKKTPTDTLRELAQDGNRIVRATARESLGKRQ